MEINSQAMSIFTATLAALAAAFSAATAFRSYKLARSLQEEAKSDERIFIGKISHPGLATRAHDDCVLQVPLFNKSKRKACVTELTVYDSKGKPISVAWSEAIDHLGNVQDPGNLVGITDAKTIYVQQNDAETFEYARLLFAHSFSESKEVAIFDPHADFARDIA